MQSDMMKDQPLRPTGLMERFNILRSQVKFYTNVQTTATYSIPQALLRTSGNVENLVYAALAEVVCKNPIMGVSLEDQGSAQPRWVRLPSIDFRKVVVAIDADPTTSFDQFLQDKHRELFESFGELPLWRVLVIASSTAVGSESADNISFAVSYFCHHAIGDGLSTAAFHLAFLSTLNSFINSATTITPSSMISVPALPLEPALEEKVIFPLSLWFTLKQVIQHFIYTPVDPLCWSGPLIDVSIPRPPISNYRSFCLPPQIVKKLVALCHNEKTTVTALVTVLVARKIAVMYPSHSHFAGAIPFSLRKFTGHGPLVMGAFVSQALPYFSSEASPSSNFISCRSPHWPTLSSSAPSDTQLWESARAVKAHIEKRTATTTDQDVALLKFVKNDLPGYFLGMLGGKRGNAFEITNIGVVDGKGVERGAKFERIAFSQSHSTVAPPHIFCLASAKGGWMTVTTSWETGVLDEGVANAFLMWLEGELRTLGESDNL